MNKGLIKGKGGGIRVKKVEGELGARKDWVRWKGRIILRMRRGRLKGG